MAVRIELNTMQSVRIAFKINPRLVRLTYFQEQLSNSIGVENVTIKSIPKSNLMLVNVDIDHLINAHELLKVIDSYNLL